MANNSISQLIQIWDFQGHYQWILPAPITLTTAPTAANGAPIGQVVTVPTAQSAYMLVAGGSGNATWINLGGGAGTFTSITTTVGPNSLAGLTTLVGGATTPANLVTTGTGTITSANGLTVTAGGLTVTSGGATIVGTTTINQNANFNTSINTGTSTGVVAIGNVANTTGLTLASGAGVTVASQANTVTNSGLILTQGAQSAQVLVGSGAPTGATLGVQGSLYINTTAVTAATRLYIATAANTWTNFTAAA